MMIAPILGLLGTAASAYGTIMGANAQSSAAKYQADVARQKGQEEVAASQRTALDTTRKTKLGLSTLQARASASGAGATDPTVVNLAAGEGGIAQRGGYQGALNLYQGRSKQWDFETEANAKDMMASAYKSMGPLSAAGTLLGGAGSAFKSFSGGSFQASLPSGDTFQSQPADDDYWERWGPKYGYTS